VRQAKAAADSAQLSFAHNLQIRPSGILRFRKSLVEVFLRKQSKVITKTKRKLSIRRRPKKSDAVIEGKSNKE